MAHIVGEIDHNGKVWAPAQPVQQEPVGEYTGETWYGLSSISLYDQIPVGTLLYTTPPAAQQEPVFCEYCGGNDEDPQDHCMDCTRPCWMPVTQKLLNAQHSWLYKDMWIAMKDGGVMTGHYKWMQGRCPDRFIIGSNTNIWAFEATHVMPMNQPKHPNEVIAEWADRAREAEAKLKAAAQPAPVQEPVAWRNAAIRLGEELSSVGPDGYYDMTAAQWIDWAMAQKPQGKNSVTTPPAAQPATEESSATQFVQEPVAWRWVNPKGWLTYGEAPHDTFKSTALYTTPPAQRQWVGLTKEDIVDCLGEPFWDDVIRKAEAKLKEKNT
jgi:hypothetical protein